MTTPIQRLPDKTEIAAELAAAVVLIKGISPRGSCHVIRDHIERAIARLDALADRCCPPNSDGWNE